jgi:hypothetical protein
MKNVLLICLLGLPSVLLAQAPVLTFTPSNGATNVSISNNLTIGSDINIKNADGSAISDANVDDLITLEDNLGNSVLFDATISGKTITVNPGSNLAESTTYTLTLQPVESASTGDETTVKIISFTTGDFTDPVVNSAKGIDNSGTGFTFVVNVNENATIHYVVDNDNTVPTRTEITSEQNGDGDPADAFGSFSVSAGVDGSATITGLSFSPTKYFIYYFAEDNSANANRSNADTKGLPLLISSSIQNLQAFQFDLRVKVDAAVTTYYVVTQSASVPSASQILAGQNESGGSPDASGNFAVAANTDTDKTISGLGDGITYYVHFVSTDASGNQTVVTTKTAATPDGTPPSVTAVNPTDGSTTVDISKNTFTITFNENIITSASSASGGSDLVKLYEEGVMKEDIVRGDGTVGTDGSIVISGSTATITFVYALKPNKNYYITIGDDVFSDAAGNDFAGYTANTDWNFKTSTVTVNNASSSICSGSFQSIGNIIISETGAGDFNVGASKTLTLTLSNTSEFVISNSGVSATGASADVSGLSVSVGLTSLTLTYTVTGTTVLDNITISGVKIYATGVATTATFLRTGGNGDMDGGNGTMGSSLTYASIDVGSSAPSAPQLAASQDLIHCEDEDISAKTLTLVDQGAVTYSWYSDPSLSVLKKSTASPSVNLVTDLGMTSPAVQGTNKFYVVTVDGCQSTSLEVTVQVAPIPLADAGPASTTVCSGSAVTLGGSPTLIGPSVTGAYQYLWSTTSPTGFVDMGSNPTVSPVSGTDITLNYTVKIVDANGCQSDILDPNATIAVNVDSTDEAIEYKSPLGTTFTLNSSPIQLTAIPSISSSYSGNGVYLSEGKYYFDPDLAGTAGSPHAITYTTNLTNGCSKTEVRNFSVSNSSASIVNLASSYCKNEANQTANILSLGSDWSNYLANDNAYYSANYGYTYEFYDFQTYIGSDTPGTGIFGTAGDAQYVIPSTLQAYPFGDGTYGYVGMRVRRRYPELGLLGIPTGNYLYDPPIFWMIQYLNIYSVPALKVSGIKDGSIVCDVNQTIELEGNFSTGTFEISRDQNNWVSGPNVGIVDNPVNSGKASFNPHNAYISTDFPAPNNVPATGITNFYIRYNYVVNGTAGSDSGPCETSMIISFQISNNPAVSWAALAKTEFCYEDPNALVATIAPPPANASQTDAISGYGVFDNGDRTASFDPDEALKAKAFATNSSPYTNFSVPEDIILFATRTDVNGCQTTINQTVKVHPLYPASFTESDLDVCYEDGPQNIVGAQSNSSYELFHPSFTVPVDFQQKDITGFNLHTYYDNAVALGADGTINQKFDLTFKTSDPALGCKNSVTKTFSVNPPIQMDIGGMTSGLTLCGNGAPIDLTGNQPSAGSFEISTSPSSGFVNNALGLVNTTTGKATYTPSGANLPAGDPQKTLYIRYSFQGPGCTGTAQTTEQLIINPQPSIAFSPSIPAANTKYCFEQSATPTTVALNVSSSSTSNLTFSGFGLTDNGDGTSVFNPTSAYQQSSLADNLNPFTDQTQRTMTITAMSTDALSCSNSTSVNYIVNPLPTATFSPAQKAFCYEDDPVTLSGGQTNVSYEFVYKNTTTPPDYNPGIILQSTTSFHPKAFFDAAVSKGANPLATLQFDVTYTSINSTTGCTNQLAPVALTVAPSIPPEMAGIEDGEIFCSNSTDRELTFNPPNGTFRIDGQTEPFSAGKYLFNPPLTGPATGTDYEFKYTIVTGNNCTNTQTKTIRVLPSPQAIFSPQPRCDGDLIDFNADGTNNLSSALYTWSLSDSIRTGQNLQHRFPGISTYSVQLHVQYPAYNNDPSLVCQDSLRLDQIVGPVPNMSFTFFNVCESDATSFVADPDIPISTVSWDFADGETTAFGSLANNIPPTATTSGTFGEPVHKYAGAGNYSVIVTGKTAAVFGACVDSDTIDVAILKNWAPSGSETAYNMSALDGGKGFWVKEDAHGNSTWEFNTAAKSYIKTNEMAWITGSTQPYKADDVSYMNSPCFDLSGFSRPVFSMKHWTDTEFSDGAVLQYSVDGGETWSRLGNVGSGLGWYDRLTISSNPGEQTDLSSGWSTTLQGSWVTGKHTLDVLPGTRDQVRFRIAFSSFTNRDGRDGFAFNDVVIEERNRTILAENFSTLDATDNNKEFRHFKADSVGGKWVFNTDEIVKLQYHHTSDQSPDILNQANPTDPNARAAFYGVTTPTRAFIDGGFGQASTNSTFLAGEALTTYFSLRSLVTAPVDISIDFPAEPSDKLNVKATVHATSFVGKPGQYNVFIAVAEQEVLGQAYVLRKFLPDASGTPLTSLSATDPAQEIFSSYDMRHVTQLTNGDYAPFAVIVFVQNLETKEVLQTAIRQDGTASTNVVTEVETLFDDYIKLYPNPADDHINMILPAPVREKTPVKVFDIFGKEVYEGTFSTGEHVKAIETKLFSAGVYLIQLSTPEGLVRQKAMIVHE